MSATTTKIERTWGLRKAHQAIEFHPKHLVASCLRTDSVVCMTSTSARRSSENWGGLRSEVCLFVESCRCCVWRFSSRPHFLGQKALSRQLFAESERNKPSRSIRMEFWRTTAARLLLHA